MMQEKCHPPNVYIRGLT